MSNPGLDILARDCLRFAMHFFPLIQQSSQHIYHSSLPLSPEMSMFRPTSLLEKTRITEFHGRAHNWGHVVRTITDTPRGFDTCMTIIGRGSTATIAAVCSDGTVNIYGCVTGVLRLSLSPPHSIQAMTGSPDGSILFCTHREGPSITLWDIQTGGLVHTFALTAEATDTAISLSGRYLACGLSDSTVSVWEVANRTGRLGFKSGSPITCLCWLAPEERLMVANKASVRIRDIATGNVRSFEMRHPVYGAAYSQKLNQLVVMTSSGADRFFTIVDTQTGASPVPYRFKQQFSCFAFSQTSEELVCGMKTCGLAFIDVSMRSLTSFDFLATIKSVSTLSNGIVVANVAGSGIQLLSLDKGYTPSQEPPLSPDEGSTPSQEPLPRALTVHPLDKGKIIAIVPTDRHCVILLGTATGSKVLTIPTPKHLPILADRIVVLCASLQGGTAVHCFIEGDKAYLQLWTFFPQNPRWTAQVNELPSAGDISPTCARLVTFHHARSRNDVHIWDVHDGRLLARVDVGWSPRLLDITFDLEDVFHLYHDTYRITYVVSASQWLGNPTHFVNYLERTLLDGRAWKREYCVDDGHEWVVSGSQRICWIPPGYIRSDQASHCWAGSSLIMAGQDGTLRTLTFRKSSL